VILGAYDAYTLEARLIETADRTGAPTQDPKSHFFGWPFDEFRDCLRELQDEAENRAYLAIVAETEGVIQLDFRARARAGRRVALCRSARRALNVEKKGRHIDFEQILNEWRAVPSVRKDPISEFKQLLRHRHWLAHGRFFPRSKAVSTGPGFVHRRAMALFEELARVDPRFPRS